MKAPALLLLGIAAVAMQSHAEPLGRLFFTPAQRLSFDQERQRGAREPAGSAIRLDGIAIRSRERPTIWINGRIQDERRLGELGPLRVGESINPITREKSDVVPDGSITRSNRR